MKFAPQRRAFLRSAGHTALAAGATALLPPTAEACTRVLWNDNGLAVIVGRTMDWPTSTDPVLTVLPRGMPRDGGRVGSRVAIPDNALRWKSRYASMVATTYGVGSADGFNERGLGAHMLYLTATDYGPRDRAMLGLQAGLWAQYPLDMAATVSEALDLLKPVQIVMVEEHGHAATLHLALEDATGDSAIIEYIAGRPVVHHGQQYRIMTNDPPYDQQIALLEKMVAEGDFTNPTRDTQLPGNVNPRDRFQRAAYFLRMLPKPANEREAIAFIASLMANVSVPFGAPDQRGGFYNTEYRSVIDLTNQIYFFQLTTIPNLIWAHLPQFDLSPGAPVMALNPDNIHLSGNVTAAFKAAPAPF